MKWNNGWWWLHKTRKLDGSWIEPESEYGKEQRFRSSIHFQLNMSIPYICGRCRRGIINWRRLLYKNQLHPETGYGASKELSDIVPPNRSLFRHRQLWTTARPILSRGQHVTKENDGHLQDIFNSVTWPSGSPSQIYRQASSEGNQATRAHNKRRPLKARGKEMDEAKEKSFLDQLDRALTMRNVVMAEGVWRDFEQWYRERFKDISQADIIHKPSSLSNGYKPKFNGKKPSWTGSSVSIYCRFLLVFMSLRRPDRANEVWKHLVQAGLSPNPALWNALLSGCRGARDTNLLEEIWKRLLNSGIKPDAVCWSTRIHALIVGGKCREGIEALKSMGNVWRKAAEEVVSKRSPDQKQISLSELGDVGSIVKPTTETINALLLTLLRTKQIELAQSMLNWASTLGIRPDLTTYNTLLRYTIQEDSPESALKIYGTMEAAGVQPDIYTFTAIFDGYFRYHYKSNSSASQSALIHSLFTEMEVAGIPPTVHTYGIMIDNLLSTKKNESDPTENFPAVQAILRHLRSKNLKPNALINTMLITYHFSRQPPDIPAVNAMWNRIKRHSDDGAATDNIFYERLLDGYVCAAEVDLMMEVFQHMARRAGGCILRWDTMRQMVSLLVDAGRSEAEGVVRDVARKEGLFRQGCRGSMESERAFWRLVEAFRRMKLLKVNVG